MLLHAGFADADFAARGFQGTVVIRSPYTGVLILAVNYFAKMANTVKMWLETGTITSTTDMRQFAPVHSICAAVGPQFCNVRPAIHSLTGSDSASSLFGIRKKIVFNVVTQIRGRQGFLLSSEPATKKLPYQQREYSQQCYTTQGAQRRMLTLTSTVYD